MPFPSPQTDRLKMLREQLDAQNVLPGAQGAKGPQLSTSAFGGGAFGGGWPGGAGGGPAGGPGGAGPGGAGAKGPNGPMQPLQPQTPGSSMGAYQNARGWQPPAGGLPVIPVGAGGKGGLINPGQPGGGGFGGPGGFGGGAPGGKGGFINPGGNGGLGGGFPGIPGFDVNPGGKGGLINPGQPGGGGFGVGGLDGFGNGPPGRGGFPDIPGFDGHIDSDPFDRRFPLVPLDDGLDEMEPSGGDGLDEVLDLDDTESQEEDDAPGDQDPKMLGIDPATERFLMELLNGGLDVDTSEEEALIRELMEQQTGQGLRDNAARMGAAGFAQSGADVAMGSDIMRRNAQEASRQILDLRRDAKQDAIDNALAGIGANVDLEGLGIDRDRLSIDQQNADADAELMDMILELADQDPTDPNAVPDDLSDDSERRDYTQGSPIVDITPIGGDDTPGSKDTPYLFTTAQRMQMARAGYEFHAVGQSYRGEIIWQDQDGNHWFARAQT